MRLPFRRSLSLRVPVSPEVVVQRVRAEVEMAMPVFSIFGDHVPHIRGKMDGDQFHIRRFSVFGNGWRPVVHGTVFPDGDGTRLDLELRPHLLAEIHAYFSCLVLVAVVVVMVVQAMQRGHFKQPWVVGVPPVVFALMYASFALEVKPSLRALLAVVEDRQP